MRACALIATLALLLTIANAVRAEESTSEMVSVEGEHIILRLRPDEMALFDDPAAWVSKLDRAYEQLADLVGKTPFNGEKIAIESRDDLAGAWARAGNPITWKREYIAPTAETVNKGDWQFGIVHEISHNFDLDRRWTWEAEIWANFKMDYAFPRTNAVVFSRGKICDYSDPNGVKLTDLYRESELSRLESDRMLNGGWLHDPYHRKLTELVEKIGWEPIKGALRWMLTLEPNQLSENGLNKRSLFFRAVDEQTDVDVCKMVLDWGFSQLVVDVPDPDEAARMIHDKDWNAQIVKRPFRVAPGEKVTISVSVAKASPTVFKKGLGTHAPAETIYKLDGKYARFETCIGVPGQVSRDGRGTVTFAVEADGKKIYESAVLRGGGVFEKIATNIAGVKELRLLVSDAGDGQSCDQAAWCDAKLVDTQGEAIYLSDLDPVSSKQGYDELHRDRDIDHAPLVFPYCPYTEPVTITGRVDNRRIRLRSSERPDVYECTLEGFRTKGEHYVWLTITPQGSKITQHELVTIIVK